jgi:hypothetical protein
MWPHRAVRVARVTVPALVTPLAGVTDPITPANDARVPYPAAIGPKPDTIRTHRAVCCYQEVKAPCWVCASGADHEEGRALDWMISDSTAGWDIAKWVAYAKSFGVSEIIQRQNIRRRSRMAGVRCRTAGHRLPIR